LLNVLFSCFDNVVTFDLSKYIMEQNLICLKVHYTILHSRIVHSYTFYRAINVHMLTYNATHIL